MNSRMLVIAATAVALAVPATATARTKPIKPATKQVIAKTAAKQTPKKAVKVKTAPRDLCICIVNPGWLPAPATSQEEFERQYDQDLVAHGLDPVYGHTVEDLIAHGFDPVYDTTSTDRSATG